jgi:hypothetical protein
MGYTVSCEVGHNTAEVPSVSKNFSIRETGRLRRRENALKIECLKIMEAERLRLTEMPFFRISAPLSQIRLHFNI